MTRPGVVAEPPLPKTGIERPRGAGPQKEAATAFGDVEREFSNLLFKLNGGAQRPDEPAPADGTVPPPEARPVRQREIASWIAQEEGGNGADLPSAGRPPAAGAPPEATADPPQADAMPLPGPETASVNDLAVVTAGAPAASQAASVAATRAAGGNENFAPAPERAAKTGPDPSSRMPTALPDSRSSAMPAAPTDSRLAGAGAPGAAAVKHPSRTQSEASGAPAASPGDAEATFPHVDALPARAELPKASVLRQETHFAPVSPSRTGPHAGAAAAEGSKPGLEPVSVGSEAIGRSADVASPSSGAPGSVAASPAQQIADRIGAEAAAFEVPDRVAAAPEQAGAKPVLKVLQIQLQPADLGTVTVRMELQETGLKLHVEADRAETAEIIRADQDTLSKLLRSAGYGIDPGSIRVVEVDRTAATAQAGQQGAQNFPQSSSQSQPGWSERHESPQRGHAGTQGGDPQAHGSRNETHDTPSNRTGRGLYV